MCLMLVFMLLYINWLNFFPSPVQSAGNLLGIWLTLFIHWPISDHTDCYFYFYISTYVIRSSVMCSPFLSRFPSPVSLRLLLTSSILCGWGSFWELLLVCLIPIRVRSLSYTWISSAEWSAFICGSFWIASFIDFFFLFCHRSQDQTQQFVTDSNFNVNMYTKGVLQASDHVKAFCEKQSQTQECRLKGTRSEVCRNNRWISEVLVHFKHSTHRYYFVVDAS